MSKRSVLAGLGLMAALGACATTSQQVAYTSPGWYLERPRLIVTRGPEIFGGPFSYEDCEARRTALPPSTAVNMICINEKTKPSWSGPY
jgi:hypothetical protein